jgi:hypothetical protein
MKRYSFNAEFGETPEEVDTELFDYAKCKDHPTVCTGSGPCVNDWAVISREVDVYADSVESGLSRVIEYFDDLQKRFGPFKYWIDTDTDLIVVRDDDDDE